MSIDTICGGSPLKFGNLIKYFLREFFHGERSNLWSTVYRNRIIRVTRTQASANTGLSAGIIKN